MGLGVGRILPPANYQATFLNGSYQSNTMQVQKNLTKTNNALKYANPDSENKLRLVKFFGEETAELEKRGSGRIY